MFIVLKDEHEAVNPFLVIVCLHFITVIFELYKI